MVRIPLVRIPLAIYDGIVYNVIQSNQEVSP
jgi:hypothetical protein